MLKKLISHSFWYSIGPQVPKFINILVLPFITPFLTAEDYGVFGTIGAYIGLLSGFQMLGMPVIMVNSFFRYKSNERWKFRWRQYFGFLIIWGIIYSLILAFVLNLFIPESAENNKLLLILILSIQSLFFLVVINMAGRLYQLKENPSYIALVSVFTGVITIVLNYYFIAILELGYMGWFYSGFVSSAVTFIMLGLPFVFKYHITPIFNFKRKVLSQELRVALPTIPHNYSSYLMNSSDRMILDQMNVDIKEIGRYNVAYVFGNYFDMIGSAIGMAVGPFLAKLWLNNKIQDFRLLIFFLQIGFLSFGFLLCIWLKELLPVLYRSPSLKGAYTFAVFIIMGYAYRPMYWSVVNKLMYEEKTNQLWKISFIGGSINVILNLIFIPIFGVIAAPITTMLSLLYLGFSGFYLKSYKLLNDLNYYPILWIIIIVFLTITAYFIVDLSLMLKANITFFVVAFDLINFMIYRKRLNSIII